MKILLACLWVVVVSALNLEEQNAAFQKFKIKYGKVYKDQDEETTRFNIFVDNLITIEEHNELYELGRVFDKQGINQFADLTSVEFRATLTLRSANKPYLNATKYVKSMLAIPESVDWRTKGHVTGVKDQGNCGSCWAFAVIGSTEAAYVRKSGNLVSLSEQQLVDCATDGNFGCRGGQLESPFKYIEKNGIQSDKSYPYIAKDGNCKYDASKVVTKISGYKFITPKDENAIMDAVANVGPVTVSLDFSLLHHYNGGIHRDDKWCNPRRPNHAVVIVGYGSENGTNFWIVKNSHGLGYGEQGYFRIIRGTNECGIEDNAVHPIIE